MTPTLGPEFPHLPPMTSRGRAKRPGNDDTPSRSLTRSLSSTSILFDDQDIDVVRVEGLRHCNNRLEARRYKTPGFSDQLVEILHSLRVAVWHEHEIRLGTVLKVEKVSGSLTNAVFFVSCPSIPTLPTLLLRIYGPSSGSLINRPRELHTLHVLSSQYHIGPRVYGTFENGRIEEYFESAALTAADLRDPKISSWIGARMAELHQVDIAAVELPSPPSSPVLEGEEWEIGTKKNFKSWVQTAREVLQLPAVTEELRQSFDLDSLEKEWTQYIRWLDEKEKKLPSPRVFAHNDTQYGNLLQLRTLKEVVPEHRQIIVVDFEYASPNPAAFDIANHFHEWTANYHGDHPHLLDPARYPTLQQRRNFYRAYLTHSSSEHSGESLEQRMRVLESQVQAWSPSSHAMWAVWGLVQAREAFEGDGEAEFDYVGYAQCRMESFRREIRALSV